MAVGGPTGQRWLLPQSATAPDDAAVFTRRALVVGMGNAAVFGGLAARLYDLQVLNGSQHAALAESNRSRTIWIPPVRGRILDARGRLLATSRELFRAVLYPQRGMTRADVARIAAELSARFGVEGVELEARLTKALRQTNPLPVILADGLSFSDIAALQVSSIEAANVLVQPRHQRVYPELSVSAQFALAHIVGHVGALDRFSLDDEPHLKDPGARIGKTGVEAGAETDLSGVAGRTVYEIDARGRHVRRLDERAAISGRDVTLTIDLALQEAVTATFATAGRGGGLDGPRSGAAVVLDIASGAILAMASTPSFDASTARAAGPEWRAYTADPARPLVNRATTGHYPPGSTFKMVTALAALEAGRLTLAEKIECWGEVTYAGHTYRCWNRRGHVATDLHRALRESCDCYFYEAARRTGIDAIAGMAVELGLGQVYAGVGIAPQRAGLIPTPAWKRSRSSRSSPSSRTGWLLGETILAGIGQGYVLATPLQLAVMTARIASGRKVIPTIIARDSRDPLPEHAPLAVSETHLVALRRAMAAVVNEPGGTGQAADPGDGTALAAGKMRVAGKTGTSQVSKASADRDRTKPLVRTQRDHALFVGYAPADAPRFAIALVLEHAGSGGTAAAPVFAELVRLLIAHDTATVQLRTKTAPLPKEG